MPMHIEKMTSEVSVQDGDLSLTQSQIEKLVALVISKLEDRARESQRACAATRLTRRAAPPFEAGK
jgi:phenylalanyl-tRNA synthetase beta subunit